MSALGITCWKLPPLTEEESALQHELTTWVDSGSWNSGWSCPDRGIHVSFDPGLRSWYLWWPYGHDPSTYAGVAASSSPEALMRFAARYPPGWRVPKDPAPGAPYEL